MRYEVRVSFYGATTGNPFWGIYDTKEKGWLWNYDGIMSKDETDYCCEMTNKGIFRAEIGRRDYKEIRK